MGYARSRNADIPGYPKPHFPGLSPKCTADDGSSVGAPRLGDRVVAQVTSYFRNPLPAAAPPNVCLYPKRTLPGSSACERESIGRATSSDGLTIASMSLGQFPSEPVS